MKEYLYQSYGRPLDLGFTDRLNYFAEIGWKVKSLEKIDEKICYLLERDLEDSYKGVEYKYWSLTLPSDDVITNRLNKSATERWEVMLLEKIGNKTHCLMERWVNDQTSCEKFI